MSPLWRRAWLLLLASCACRSSPGAAGDAGPASSASATPIDPADAAAVPAVADAGDSADAAPPDTSVLPGTTAGCPDDMVLVTGNYCRDVDQKCIEHHDEYKKDKKRKKKGAEDNGEAEETTVSERCLRYAEPTVCLSEKLRPMRFCVDRYEWPNKRGELPLFLISWYNARKKCEEIGKRLCTENEFNFACEGEKMLPYTYGFVRDAAKCNIDKPYRKRERSLYHYDNCMKRPKCKAEIEALDKRAPAGSMPECVSPFGAYDMNGNINEWVFRPGKKFPWRSGLKGGWWGPVRNRCRPTVGFHKEDDFGYEAGFRCCKDAEPG